MKVVLTLSFFLLVLASCHPKPGPSLNDAASDLRASSLDFNPMAGQLISSGIDTADHLMFTLYGNPAAVAYARCPTQAGYPVGAILSRITWKQQPDARWFGGNIPSSVAGVEVIRFVTGTDGSVRPAYRHYAGDGAGADAVISPGETAERIQHICSIRASVMP